MSHGGHNVSITIILIIDHASLSRSRASLRIRDQKPAVALALRPVIIVITHDQLHAQSDVKYKLKFNARRDHMHAYMSMLAWPRRVRVYHVYVS